MKKYILILTALLGLSCLQTFAAPLQSISCSGSSTVNGPLGSTSVSVSNATINGASCNTCFYAGHVYKGFNIPNWFDTFTVVGNMQRLMWQDDTWVAWATINSNFTWGNNIGGNFSFSAIGWNQVVTPGPDQNRLYRIFNVGDTGVKYIEAPASNGISLNTAGTNAVPAHRNTAGYVIGFNGASHSYDPSQPSGSRIGPLQNHVQCAYIFPRWCGDNVRDTDHNEQCDDGNMNSGDGCSNTCQTEITPVCNNLTVTPTSVTNGGTITYTCGATNASSYSIVARRPDGSILTSSTSAAGSIILPASPAGNYTVSCFINGQVSTPASCQKTVTNTVPVESCDNLAVSPTSLTNGGTVTYTCTGTNVTSYSIIAERPDGSTFNSSTSSSGSITFPTSPAGTYAVKCFVNGQVSTPASCQKTVTNTVVNEPVCTGLTITPSTLTDGGNVNYTCTGTNVSSYSVVFSKPDGTTLQSFSSATGTATVPATPTGTYTARCFVNGQTSTPAICEKTLTNSGTSVTPAILITKTDANNADLDGNIGGNDSQTVYSGSSAIFRIRVTNTGTEDLKNIVLTDAIAPSCAGGVTLPSTFPSTWSSFVTGGSGNHSDNLLQPGEYFEYICDRGNTTSNYTNVARVDAQGNISNTPVLDDDPTVVIIQPVVNTTCNELTLSTSGNTVNYSCTGSGNITSYSILQNGAQISTNASGSVNVTNGTHTFICYVNNSITSASCQKTITINPTAPQILVIKDDNDDHDDAQFIQNGGSAQFTVVVKNPGSEPLDTVTLSDPYAPECNRTSAETLNLIVNVGNRDARLDPGESFSYICTRPNTTQSTFPNNENRICVNGRGITSGIVVNSCDVSRVSFGTPMSLCQNIQVSQNGNQMNVSCSPNGGYKLFVLQGQQVINTFQNPTGQFAFALNDGTYKVVCLRDGEQTVQPGCQKTVVVNPKQDYCTLESTVRYGGAPLRTQLSCSSQTYAQCMIRIDKDGKPWRSVANCNADIIFAEKGVYDATCVIGDLDTQSCSTRVQVDIMTIIQTGPFMPILILLSLGMAGYITYRRKKA